MKLAMIGLGKLGLPVAVALGQKHEVVGFDVNPDLMRKRKYEHRELGPELQDDFQYYFDKANLSFAPSVEKAIEGAEIIFVAVQTPHSPMYEGITRLPESREDFNYSHLVSAIRTLAPHVKPEQTVAVISTVLPGTMRREMLPIIGDRCRFVYNPFFIAMGTVMRDFMNPEFVLLGIDSSVASLGAVLYLYHHFYDPLDVPIRCMSVESAELTKVAYNLFITTKIAYANTLMEICHKMPGCNVDDVTNTLALATDRIVSPKYLKGGMGDGGACHGRDAIAMSWLARKLRLRHDPFESVMRAREKQTEWFVEIIGHQAEYNALPIVILGKAFKANTAITTGSPALLLAELLKERRFTFSIYDPHVDGIHKTPNDFGRAVFFIAAKHDYFQGWQFPEGSIVIDPWRYIPEQDGVKLVPLGVGK